MLLRSLVDKLFNCLRTILVISSELGKTRYLETSLIKIKKPTMLLVDFVAGVEGFEPSQAVLETDVLPLTLYP